MAIEIIGRLTGFNDTKANCEASSGILGEMQFAGSSDTGEFGINFGAGWRWYPTGTSSIPMGGSGNTLLIYDDSTFKVTGTAINFGSNLSVSVTGSVAFVDATGGSSLTVKELDGSPSVSNVTEIKVTNGKLTDNGGGSVSLDLSVTGTSSSYSEDGWLATNETWTFSSADAPSYVISTPSDVTQKYSPGMRVKFTQGGIVQYSIITKVTYASSTGTLTFYSGTDYSVTGTTISSPYYSTQKAPLGFPLDPSKWTVTVTDVTERGQNSPVQNTWYNLGSISISIPIGSWRTIYHVAPQVNVGTAAGVSVTVTLSTANNSESDSELSAFLYNGNVSILIATVTKEKTITAASKTSYYLNTRTILTSMVGVENRNDLNKLVIRAICAYL